MKYNETISKQIIINSITFHSQQSEFHIFISNWTKLKNAVSVKTFHLYPLNPLCPGRGKCRSGFSLVLILFKFKCLAIWQSQWICFLPNVLKSQYSSYCNRSFVDGELQRIIFRMSLVAVVTYLKQPSHFDENLLALILFVIFSSFQFCLHPKLNVARCFIAKLYSQMDPIKKLYYIHMF